MTKSRHNIVTRMKAERLRRQWTQTDLAYHSRMSPSDVSRIENGLLIPYPGYAKRLAKALGLSPEELQRPAKREAMAVAHGW